MQEALDLVLHAAAAIEAATAVYDPHRGVVHEELDGASDEREQQLTSA